MSSLVLVRHGESRWNREGRFSGWADVDLTRTGEDQARAVGRLLRGKGFAFDLAVTSALKRTIRSQWLILDALDQQWIPLIADWRFNERHYGALTGQNRAEMERAYGEDQVRLWRRGYEARPPAMAADAADLMWGDRRYARAPRHRLPLTESLKDTVERVGELFDDLVAPVLLSGGNVVMTGHGNSLRALLKRLNHISDADVAALEVPNAAPIVLDLDDHLDVVSQTWLQIDRAAESFVF